MPPIPSNEVIPGDCIQVLADLPENSVDLVFADPPYNLQLSQELLRPDHSSVSAVEDDWDKFSSLEEYDQFTHLWLSACRRVLKPTGTLWVIGTYHNIYRVGAILQDLGFWILNDIVWIKTNPMPNFRGVRFTNAHETLLWSQKTKGARYTFNYHTMKSFNEDLQMRSDWTLPLCTGQERLRLNGAKVHSTQKPEALLYRVLLSSTNPGDIVLDPFFGTGTTGAVAKKLGRNFIGIERDERYINSSRERIATTTPASTISLGFPELRNQLRVPFSALLESGLLQPGQMLYFEKDQSTIATILANGQLRCGNLTGSIHSVATSLFNGFRANGWDCWLYEQDGKRFSINILRQLIREGQAENYE